MTKKYIDNAVLLTSRLENFCSVCILTESVGTIRSRITRGIGSEQITTGRTITHPVTATVITITRGTRCPVYFFCGWYCTIHIHPLFCWSVQTIPDGVVVGFFTTKNITECIWYRSVKVKKESELEFVIIVARAHQHWYNVFQKAQHSSLYRHQVRRKGFWCFPSTFCPNVTTWSKIMSRATSGHSF